MSTREKLLSALEAAAETFTRTESNTAMENLRRAAYRAHLGGIDEAEIAAATERGAARSVEPRPRKAASAPKARTSKRAAAEPVPPEPSAAEPKRSSRKARTSRPAPSSVQPSSVEPTSAVEPVTAPREIVEAAEDAERLAALAEAPVAQESEAAPGTPEAVAEEAAAEVVEQAKEAEPTAAVLAEIEVRVSGPEPGAGGGWENALSTKLAATRCCFCARSLRDPESIERGYGPECAEKFWMPHGVLPEDYDEAAAVRAFKLMPPLLRGSMERIGGGVDDANAAWRSSPETRRRMVSSALYVGALAVSFGANEVSVVRAKVDSAKLVLASLQQLAGAFYYAKIADRLATKYVERLEGNAIVFRRSPKAGYLGVHVPYSEKWLEWCRGNRGYFAASQRDGSLFFRFFEESKLGFVANALHGCFGDTICIDADGNMVPLPTMHVEAETPAPAVDVVADDVKVIEEVQPYAVPDSIKIGDFVRIGGRDIRVNYIDPTRSLVGLGQKPGGRGYELFKSFAEIKQLSGREIAKDLYQSVVRYTQEIGVQAPPPPTTQATARPIPVLSDGATLDPHQVRGVEFIDGRSGRVILADEQGLGKTITATVCIDAPAVVVCPSNLKINWMRELLKWKQGVTVSVVEGKQAPPEASKKADVIVINYDILSDHVDWLRARNNKTIVADEAQYLKQLDIRWKENANQPTSDSPARGKAFYKLQRDVPRLLLLSGTPVMNRTRELFPLLHMVDPREWRSSYNFCIQYCGGHRTAYGFDCNGRTNSEELFRRINDKFMLRRTVDVLNLPPKRYEPTAVGLSDDVRPKYERQVRDIIDWVRENGGPEAAARASRAEVLVQLNKLRETTAEGKADAAVDWIKRHWVSTGRPLVVMAVHKKCFERMKAGVDRLNREYQDQLERGQVPDMQAPIRYGEVVGGLGSTEVTRVVDQFQGKSGPPSLDLVFYSISLAVGTTLTRAQDMLFVERAWRPADLAQAEARIFRRGQKNSCLFAYLDAEGTIDGKLALLLKQKAQTIAGVMHGVNLDEEDAAALILGEMFLSPEQMRRNPSSDPMSMVADSWTTPL